MDSLKLKEVFNTPIVLNQLWARSDQSPTWRQEVSEAADAETSEEVMGCYGSTVVVYEARQQDVGQGGLK